MDCLAQLALRGCFFALEWGVTSLRRHFTKVFYPTGGSDGVRVDGDDVPVFARAEGGPGEAEFF